MDLKTFLNSYPLALYLDLTSKVLRGVNKNVGGERMHGYIWYSFNTIWL